MAFKFILMVVIVSVATVSAGTGFILPSRLIHPGSQSLPSRCIPLTVGSIPSHRDQFILHHTIVNKNSEYNSHPQYKYGYNIQDSISGDSKSQTETRDGNKVNGEYSLIDADGFKRIVQYTSDSINGFNAVVTRIPIQGLKNVKTDLVSLPIIAPQHHQSVTELPLPYVSASAQEIDYEPVVKGAYAVRPIVRAVPVAYPVSKGHGK